MPAVGSPSKTGTRTECTGPLTCWRSFCLVGGIGRAQRDLDWSPTSLGDAAWVAPLLGFDAAPDMVDWNDAPGRTREEVVARLRQAAENA